MKAIWKYPLDVTDKQVIQMPANAKVLSVADQAGVLTIWALVDVDAEKEARKFYVVGTGHPLDFTGANFLGSVQQGPFVWHVFVEMTVYEAMRGLL